MLPCETSFAIKCEKDAFFYKPEKLVIQPQTTETLFIRANPLAPYTDDQLIIAIKNNPKIEIIDLRSEGCKLSVDISPKLIYFDRVLIDHIVTKTLTVRNDSCVPLNWEFVNYEIVLQYFEISSLSGFIEAMSAQKVTFQFMSESTQNIPLQKLEIEVSFGIPKLIKNGVCK